MKQASLFSVVLMFLLPGATPAKSTSESVRQPREVVEAYKTVGRFRTMMAEDLNFARAFEATFVKNAKRRREIAITESEFNRHDVRHVDTASLVSAYKSLMQIYMLMVPLLGLESEVGATPLFPPGIKEMLDKKTLGSPRQFRLFAAHLKREAMNFRKHVDRLIRENPAVEYRFRKFKEELLKKIEPPNVVVMPLTAYSRGRVLKPTERYYRIEDYDVIQENGVMRIIGIRFFSRLF